MVCKNCNTENLDSAVFCKNCGTRIDGKIVCPTCNFANESNNVFCSKCGTRIDGKKFCNNCGSEIDGLFCTTCGQKYEENTTKPQKQTINQTKITSVSKILNLTANSILMLGAVLSLIFIFFIGISAYTESTSIYYFFSEAYVEIAKTLESLSKTGYSASFETGLYFGTIISTLLIAISLIGCITFAILAIIRFIKKLYFNKEKSPALFSLLSIAFFLSCAIYFKNLYFASANNTIQSIGYSLNGATTIGIILTSICALLYFVIHLVENALTLTKQKIASYILTGTTTLTLITVFIFSSNIFVNINDSYNEIIISFPLLTNIATLYDMDMLGFVIINGFIQLLLYCSLFACLYATSKSMNFKNNTYINTILISSIHLIIMILTIVSCSLFSSIESSSAIKISSPFAIVAFIVSLIPLTLSIINSALNKKSENIKLLNN